jgi:hypothetical protein
MPPPYVPPLWFYLFLFGFFAALTIYGVRRQWFVVVGVAGAITLCLLGDIGAIIVVSQG